MGNLGDFNIDWNKVEEVDYKALPKGDYAAKVVDSCIKPTSKGDTMACLTFEVLGKNRKIFENYMLKHPNPKAVSAGTGKLKSLGAIIEVDFASLQDTSEYHGKPVGIKVELTTSEKYGEQNRIAGFFEYSEDLLNTDEDTSEDIKVEEPDIVEDEVEDEVEADVVEDDPEETKEDLELRVTPAEIQAFKKDALIAFIKENELPIEMSGKKVSELKDAVIEIVYGTETEEDDDIVID